MPDFTYTRGIPAASHNPSVDQPNMQVNNDSIDSVIGIDHYGFNDNNGGYHKVIHQPTQGTWDPVTRTGEPANIPGLGEVFSLLYTPDYTNAPVDTQLFAQTGNGGVSQLTGSSSTTDGWQWVGGILIQWGQVPPPAPTGGTFAGGTANGTVTFKNRGPANTGIPFPKECFSIVATPTYFPGFPPQAFKPAAIAIAFPLSNTSFDWSYNSTSAAVLYTGFTWIAIGW